ncbi:Pyoverdine biosynthesis [Penicillium macrosclerotiorum]|uniref:Pyoverdine biosynthesis n=1 Tax=Penicillium macrosclerotiorum TaxID=303699 RepID=UPI0025488AA9|nr:Pyoverdine biosynthesis [Penicillium macrosclerotiorum]KAJ5688866.1 Pyoverdine biosynthesis [Penicillium macrosclerotiorum]
MIAPEPVADTAPVLYSQKITRIGIDHSSQAGDADRSLIDVATVDLAPMSESDSPAPSMITANGNGSTKQGQNLISNRTSSSLSFDAVSNDREMAVEILKIIERYGVDYEKNGASWKGLESFVPTVIERVKRQEPIRMILPAFPFKSPNARDKVLGTMPDFGEELALAHLNGLCENIRQVYKPGADVYISSDGLVYNDILGVPDETVWDYGEKLRQMAVEKGLHHVKFIRLFELLEHPWFQTTSPEAAKAFYLAHASCLRRELMFVFGDPNFNADEAIKTDNDTCLTYRGYIKFLTKDLAHQDDTQTLSKRAREKQVAQIARQMIIRGKMFAAAIKANRGDYVRLSIHESAGEKKLSVSLVPQIRGALGFTPWHASVAIGLDGSYRTVHAEDVRDTHDLIYKNGQPYFFREKSEIFDWAENGLAVKFEHLYPCGVIIRPADIDHVNPPPSISAIPMHKVRKISNIMSPVVLRGFTETLKEDLYVEAGSQLGAILPWSFGIIQKVRDAGRSDKLGNNVTSNEAMPMHFDGMFKFEEVTDPETGEKKKVQRPPGYQFFTCPATAPKGSGYTLFASSRLFFRYLPLPWTAERLQNITWAMDNDGFWDAKLKNLPLIVKHPVSGLPCVRWHQPWDSTKTKFSTCDVKIENDDASLIKVIDQVTYDQRVCLRFEWEKGDLLISDNTSMLHTRTGYISDCDRELWRIHFD